MANEWTPLVQATEFSDGFGNKMACPKGETIYVNEIYQVSYRELEGKQFNIVHLSIKRRDKMAHRDWRHYQAIKNQLCGDESCAIEFYPPESQLVDTANQYHLWVFPDASIFPFIFQQRAVSETEFLGNRQRKFEEALRPSDLMSVQQMWNLNNNTSGKNQSEQKRFLGLMNAAKKATEDKK